MRRILFTAGFGFHGMFNSILEYPPQGYEFIFPGKSISKKPQISKEQQLGKRLPNYYFTRSHTSSPL